MTPRRKAITDTTVANLACDLLIRRGPAAVTFAQVAEHCGLAPPTLVQRFGTREGLLAVVAGALHARVAEAFRVAGGTRLEALRNALTGLAGDVVAAIRLASATPLDQYALELRKQISLCLATAVEAGELPRCDVAQLARVIQIAVVGAACVSIMERMDAALEIDQALSAQLASYI